MPPVRLAFSASVIAALSAVSAPAVQFSADRFGLPWPASDGSAALSPVHSATNGWTPPTRSQGGVSFLASPNGVPSPLWMGDAATNTMSFAVLVADCAERPVPWSTLLDAPSATRIAPAPFPWQSTSFETNVLAVSVDGGASDMEADGMKHLVEIRLPTPVAASTIFLGGHPATPAWRRSWPGRVYEVVFLETEPTGDDFDALRAYLAIRWEVGRTFSAPPDARDRLRSLGVRSDPVFSSIVIMR